MPTHYGCAQTANLRWTVDKSEGDLEAARFCRRSSISYDVTRFPAAVSYTHLDVYKRQGQDWAFCRIGGQLIPIHAQEVPEVYRQVRQMLKQRLTVEPIPVMASAGPEMGARIQSWFPSMPEESTASGKLKLISPKSETPYGSQWDSDTGSSLRETAAR